MFKLFGKKEETVSRGEYDAKLALIAALEHDASFYRRRIHQLGDHLTAARAEAEANKVDAEKYRRSLANLALGSAASAAKRKAAANG